jgi:hypothetical protein
LQASHARGSREAQARDCQTLGHFFWVLRKGPWPLARVLDLRSPTLRRVCDGDTRLALLLRGLLSPGGSARLTPGRSLRQAIAALDVRYEGGRVALSGWLKEHGLLDILPLPPRPDTYDALYPTSEEASSPPRASSRDQVPEHIPRRPPPPPRDIAPPPQRTSFSRRTTTIFGLDLESGASPGLSWIPAAAEEPPSRDPALTRPSLPPAPPPPALWEAPAPEEMPWESIEPGLVEEEPAPVLPEIEPARPPEPAPPPPAPLPPELPRTEVEAPPPEPAPMEEPPEPTRTLLAEPEPQPEPRPTASFEPNTVEEPLTLPTPEEPASPCFGEEPEPASPEPLEPPSPLPPPVATEPALAEAEEAAPLARDEPPAEASPTSPPAPAPDESPDEPPEVVAEPPREASHEIRFEPAPPLPEPRRAPPPPPDAPARSRDDAPQDLFERHPEARTAPPEWLGSGIGVSQSPERDRELGSGKWDEEGRPLEELAQGLSSQPARGLELRDPGPLARFVPLLILLATLGILGVLSLQVHRCTASAGRDAPRVAPAR